LIKFEHLGNNHLFGAFLNLLMKGVWSLEMSLWAFCENIFLTAQWQKVIHKNRQLNEKFMSIP